MVRSFFISTICTIFFLPVVLLGINAVTAQTMSSLNFQMESDSINVGGGSASSDQFRLEDTVGEVASGDSSSDDFQLQAGFQQMQSVRISMTAPDAVQMSPNIPGVAGGFSNGSTTVTVTTDNPAGYQILISAEGDPALQQEDGPATIADYSPVSASDYNFITLDSDAHMGYTVVSSHAVARFFNDESICGTGSLNTGAHCWAGLSTAPTIIVSSSNSNHPSGTETKVLFRVGVGGSVLPAPGVYIATTTLTAIPL